MSPNQPASPSVAFPGNPRHPAPEDLVVYAMQLFSTEESAAIDNHLERCTECCAELARIHSDLALAAATVELQTPSPESRQRFLQQVAREKKIVPIARPQTPPEAEHPPIASFGRSASILSIDDHQPRRRGLAVFATTGWVAAAALVFAVIFQYKDRENLRNQLITQGGQIQRLDADAASAHQLMDALTDPRAVRVTLTTKPQPKPQATAGITYNPDRGTLIFLASNLDPLQAYKTYELWVIPADGTAPIPAGTFHPDDQGNASVIMPDLPKGVTAKTFGVTIEPDGGSQTPTPPIIMAGS